MGRERQAWSMHLRILHRLFGRRSGYTRLPASGAGMIQGVKSATLSSRPRIQAVTRQVLPQQMSAKPLFRKGATNHLASDWHVGPNARTGDPPKCVAADTCIEG